MGWLYMQSMGGFSGPRQYLDNQFTFARETVRATVLRSALVRMRTYYAAVELLRPKHPREVLGLVCLVRHNPRDREGYIFGYKDIDEAMGPCEAGCPPPILDLLTPTENALALAWRETCRAAAPSASLSISKADGTFAGSARRTTRPRLRNGWRLVFDQPVTFTDGTSHARLEVVIDPSRPRAVRLRPPGGCGLYRIGNLGTYRFRIELSA